MIGEKINGYNIVSIIGQGGMSKVYYGVNTLGKKAAIKVLRENIHKDQKSLKRFHNEAITLSKMKHENICEVYDLIEYKGSLVIVMEFLEGNDLSTYINSHNINNSVLYSIYLQIRSALIYAHSLNIVHRDIKPSNILLKNDGKVKILDFGIAKILGETDFTTTTKIIGTTSYMSPEQIISPKEVDGKTDLYSLGITLYHLLLKKLPYSNTESQYLFFQEIINKEIDFTSNISSDWKNILSNLTFKNPQNRSMLINSAPAELKSINIQNAEVDYHINMVEGLRLLVCNKNGQKLFGYCNRNFKTIIPCKFDDATEFSEGLCGVKENDRWGFIDTNGNIVIDFLFQDISNFSDGMAAVQNSSSKWGYINQQGELVIDFIFKNPVNFKNGFARIEKKTKKLLFIDWIEINYLSKNGEWLLDKPIGHGFDFNEDLVAVTKNGKWGFINKEGQVQIPFQYDQASWFSEGLAAVELNSKYGFINKNNEVVINFKFEMCQMVIEGMASFLDNEKWGFIDKNGLEVIPSQFDSVGHFSYGLALVEQSGLFGFINKKGEIIIPIIYDQAKWFDEFGFCSVILNNELFVLDIEGRNINEKNG